LGIGGETGGEIGEEDSGNARFATAGRGELCELEGGAGGFGAEAGVVGKALRDDVEGFAGALECEESFDVLFGEAGDLAGVVPTDDSGAEPAVVVRGVAAIR
jgi:hypothetical protein